MRILTHVSASQHQYNIGINLSCNLTECNMGRTLRHCNIDYPPWGVARLLHAPLLGPELLLLPPLHQVPLAAVGPAEISSGAGSGKAGAQRAHIASAQGRRQTASLSSTAAVQHVDALTPAQQGCAQGHARSDLKRAVA